MSLMPTYNVTVYITTEAEDEDYEGAIEEWRSECADVVWLGDDEYSVEVQHVEEATT
jgi:hypothetical protein